MGAAWNGITVFGRGRAGLGRYTNFFDTSGPVDIYGGQSVEVLGHVNAQTRKLATGRGPLKLCDDLGSHV